MAIHFYRTLYRFRMRAHVETLFRRSERERQEKIGLKCSLMRLGNELRQSEHWSSAARQPVRREGDAAKTLANVRLL